MNYQKGNISVIVSFIIVIGIIGLVVYGLISTNKEVLPKSQEEVISNTEQQPAENIQVEEPVSTSQNNMEKVAKNGDTLVMNYTGRFTDGKVFDSNIIPMFNHVEPFKFKLGAGQVIKGWDEGLVGMKIGEKKTLTLPPEKAYGASGQGSIPPNSTLIFDVELVGIE